MSYSRSLSLRKTLIAGAVGIAVFGLTAQPVLAAGNIFQQVQQSITGQFEKLYLQIIPGDKPGKLVLRQVGLASQNLKSFDGKTSIQVTAAGTTDSVGTATLTISGPTVMGQVWDTKSYKQDVNVTGSLSYNGKSYEAAANLRMVDGVTYLQVTQMPELSGVSLKDIQNTWVKFEPLQATASANAKTWTPEQQAKLQDAFYKMLNSSDVSPAKVEKKDGNDVYVLIATISKPALAEYFTAIRQLETETLEKNGESAAAAMTPADTEKMLANVGEIKATFWIDKSSFFPRHMELPLTIDVKKAAADENMTDTLPKTIPVDSVESLDLKITSDLSKHNQSFTIVAPEGAEDSRVFFTKIMGIFMPGLSGMGGTGSMMLPTGTLPSGAMMPKTGVPTYRMPNVGSTELPTMSPEQLKALQQYEEMMKNLPTEDR